MLWAKQSERVTVMSFDMTDEMKNYFDSLPMNLQQELTQSGISVTSLKELKQVVRQFSGDTDEQ